MAGSIKNYDNYGDIKQRLDDITAAVEDEGVSLDDALDLYDEAVKLAMRASELVEIDVPASTAQPEVEGAGADLAVSDAPA